MSGRSRQLRSRTGVEDETSEHSLNQDFSRFGCLLAGEQMGKREPPFNLPPVANRNGQDI